MVPDCISAAPLGPLCPWHHQHGEDAGNARAWRQRVRRLYLVTWPEHHAFKVGVEAAGPSRRITKWVASGATVLAVWHLTDPNDTDAVAHLAATETHILTHLRARDINQPSHEEWLPVVDPGNPSAARADGRSEVFYGNPTHLEVETLIDHYLDGHPIHKTHPHTSPENGPPSRVTVAASR